MYRQCIYVYKHVYISIMHHISTRTTKLIMLSNLFDMKSLLLDVTSIVITIIAGLR